jgi:hypothetical protein
MGIEEVPFPKHQEYVASVHGAQQNQENEKGKYSRSGDDTNGKE